MTNQWGSPDDQNPWGAPASATPDYTGWGAPAEAAPDHAGWGAPADTPPDPWDFLPTSDNSGWDTQTSKYTKKALIARHGQGEVWLGNLAGTDKQFAIKYLLTTPGATADQATVRRFEREVRAQSTLDHPGIMPIVYSNFDDSPPWFVMPLAWGSLRTHFNAILPAKMSEENSAALIIEVAEALSHAHTEGIIHRDVKPENILFLDGKWVLADFGLCRDHTSTSTTFTQVGAFGTYEYMAPEQYTDAHNAKAPADIYSIGKVFFECLTGVLPYPSPDMNLVPALFKYIITKCLNPDPRARYVSLEAFINDVKALTAPQNDLALPLDHAQKLSAAVLAGRPQAASQLTQFLLANSADEIFLSSFLPHVMPPVLAAMQQEDQHAFAQIVEAFDRVCSGSHPFSWTDSAARFLQSVFLMSNDPGIRQMVLSRILRLGTEHHRWAVRDIYVDIIKNISFAPEVLMVANQLAEYPEGAAFVRPRAEGLLLPSRIMQALAA